MLTLNDAKPIARKQHQCDDCFRVIEKAEQYRRWSGIGDDGPYTWKSCAHCTATAALILKADRDAYDPNYGLDIAVWLDDLAGDYGLTELRDQFRARWRDTSGALASVPVLGSL